MDARAKFELRRKKILENAEARLQRIMSGRVDSLNRHQPEPPSASPPLLCSGFPAPGEENRLDSAKVNGGGGTMPESCFGYGEHQPSYDWPVERSKNGVPSQLLLASNNNEVKGSYRETELQPERRQPSPLENHHAAQQPAYKKETWKDYTLFLIAGVVVRMSFMMGYGWLLSENILAPFLIICIPRLFYLARYRQYTEGMIYTLMLLANFRQTNTVGLLSVLYVLRQMFQFLTFYILAFVLVHCLLESFTELLQT